MITGFAFPGFAENVSTNQKAVIDISDPNVSVSEIMTFDELVQARAENDAISYEEAYQVLPQGDENRARAANAQYP